MHVALERGDFGGVTIPLYKVSEPQLFAQTCSCCQKGRQPKYLEPRCQTTFTYVFSIAPLNMATFVGILSFRQATTTTHNVFNYVHIYVRADGPLDGDCRDGECIGVEDADSAESSKHQIRHPHCKSSHAKGDSLPSTFLSVTRTRTRLFDKAEQ